MDHVHQPVQGPCAWGRGNPKGDGLHLAWRALLPPWSPPPALGGGLGLPRPSLTHIYSGEAQGAASPSGLAPSTSRYSSSMFRQRLAKPCRSSAATTTTTMPSCWFRSHLPPLTCLLDQEGE